MGTASLSDSVFPEARKPASHTVDELVNYARTELGLGPERPWRLISSDLKLRKVFFEVEEIGGPAPRRIIGKVATSKRAQGAYEILRRLWNAGFCPPSAYCVCEPIAFFPEYSLLLQGRAPGTQLAESVRSHSAQPGDIERAAEWLVALQRRRVRDAVRAQDGHFDHALKELPAAIPSHASRIARITGYIAEHSDNSELLVPSHGDFHLMNIFIDGKRATAIDLDTFALREPMADVGYFIAQSAIMGYHTFRSFDPTEQIRKQFAAAYRRHSPELFDLHRIRVHVALAFLRSLHYDFCILKTNPLDMIDPFLAAVERCIGGESIRLAA